MVVTSLSNAPKISSGLDAYKMYSSTTIELVHLHLLPGEKVPVHKNEHEVVFCIIEGAAILEAEDAIHRLGNFDVIQIPAGIDRGVYNESNSDLRILVIKKLA